MSLGKCDVCHTNDAIGVASTSQPFSCAYCGDCAAHGADPEWIFQFLLADVANGDPSQIREGLTTWRDGAYLTFHEWAERFGQAKEAEQ